MELVRCLVGAGTLATMALVATVGAVRPPVLAATDPPWQPTPCGEARAGDVPIGAAAGPAWYRLDPLLDERGSLTGQRLTVGLVGGPARHLVLAPESFASGPVDGRLVLVGDDDGAESRLRLLDVARGCETAVDREAEAVIRGALLAPDGSAVWEHRVNRVTRADEGIWRRPVAGDPSERVLPGLPANGRFGPTFVTELSWAADGRLGISSCGERACRTRVMDPATGSYGRVRGYGPAGRRPRRPCPGPRRLCRSPVPDRVGGPADGSADGAGRGGRPGRSRRLRRRIAGVRDARGRALGPRPRIVGAGRPSRRTPGSCPCDGPPRPPAGPRRREVRCSSLHAAGSDSRPPPATLIPRPTQPSTSERCSRDHGPEVLQGAAALRHRGRDGPRDPAASWRGRPPRPKPTAPIPCWPAGSSPRTPTSTTSGAAGGTPPAAIRTAINDAADDSNASRKSKAPTFTYDTGGGNTVYYGVDVPCGVNGLACFRRDAPTWFAISLRENGHRFDWGTLRWCELNGDPDGCYDAENVVLDELGHVLGLDHHVNYADDSDYADAVVQTYTHCQAARRLARARLRAVRRRDAPAAVRRCVVVDALQHLPGRPDPDDARGDARQRGRRLQGHVHGHPDQRRRRTPVEQPHVRSGRRPPAAQRNHLGGRPDPGSGDPRRGPTREASPCRAPATTARPTGGRRRKGCARRPLPPSASRWPGGAP